MKTARWKHILPAVQLAFALACHVYEPHESRVNGRWAGNDREYRFQHTPARTGRISKGLNFPALVLDYPLRHADNPILYEHNSAYTLIQFTPRDVGFFLGLVFFWWWVGRKLDTGWRQEAEPHRRSVTTIVALVCGACFALLTGAYANQMIDTAWLPERQIAAFGIIWAAVLAGYLAWRLHREARADSGPHVSPVGPLAFMLMIAVLWVGGPSGGVQALGEFLRPTRAGMKPISANCTSGAPPVHLMQIVESERASHHLALGKIVVCTSPLLMGEGREVSFLTHDLEGRWLPFGASCCSYQYRRHVDIMVAGDGPNGPVIVEADLIQSRWDYLRLNWNKLRASWFWPYPRSIEE